MLITDVRTMLLRGPDPHGVGGTERQWDVLVVRVDTDAGVYGIGEAAAFPGVREAIERQRALLVGRDPRAIRPFVRTALYGGLPPFQPQMSMTASPLGPVAWAASGIEIALCDVVGKATGLPVHALLGGAFRDRVRVYLDRSGVSDPTDDSAWVRLGEQVRRDGFRELKFDAEWIAPELSEDPWNRGLSDRQIRTIVDRLMLVREAVGPDVSISLDCHWSYDVESAVRLARAVEPVGLRWLEDPLPMLDVKGLAEVRRRTSIPICAGEMLLVEQFRDLVAARAIDIAHPDVLFVGGLHEARRVADLCDVHRIGFALHNNGSSIATIAAAHVAAASANLVGLEYHFFDAEWIGAIAKRDLPLFDDGHVPLSSEPGLGITLDTEVCAARLAPGEVLLA